ncbi:GumC family protein [Aporhodopirellula aestuarii]|uniref:Tyrosine-protein kinase G-rich domain-containing protein n=1 Tax=Aporhodopirellula aestuarii TaxID=2950107 RepID=A0ABT0UG82_9BACT|nr:GNVR domain-containing protein [Aporhodopirellula aestuarii]MCM2375143.1 hypothetical protein [Aporhodopirellula aestuarii]
MQHRPFMLDDAIRGVMRRKTKVALFFFSTVALVGCVTLMTPKTYTSDARLFLRLGRENAALDATATLGEHPVVMMPQSRQAEINSVVELLKSKQLYQAVVEEVGAEPILERDYVPPGESSGEVEEETWIAGAIGSTMSLLTSWGVLNDLPREERAVIELQKDVDVEAFEESNVITLSFESYSPELAQSVVDSLVRNYIHEHVRLHRSVGTHRFLAEQTEVIHSELVDRQEELESLKNKTRVLSSDLHRGKMVERIAELESQLLHAEAEATSLKTEVDHLARGLSSLSSTQTVSETVGAGNEGADGMRQELFRLEMAYQDLLATYKEPHPKVQQMNERLEQSRKVLAAAELGRREMVSGPNQVYQETSVALMLKRPALAAAEARVAKLKEQIEAFQVDLDHFISDELQFARLDREISILDGNYRKYAVNLQRARIDEMMKAEELSNVSVAQAASLNLKPAKPNKAINLLLAIFLGAAGGIAMAVLLEYRHPTLSSSNDIEMVLGLPVISSVPKLAAAERLPELGPPQWTKSAVAEHDEASPELVG